MAHPRLLRQLWILLAVLVWCALGAWLAGLAGFASSAWLMVLFAAVAAVGVALLNRHTTARRWLLGAVAAAAVVVFATSLLEPNLVLALDGREVTAVVTYVDVSSGSHGKQEFTYSLRQLDGTPISGQLVGHLDDTYQVGQHVVVIEDPAGMADPSVPANLGSSGYVASAGVGLLGLVLCLVMIGRAGDGEDPIWPFVLRMYGIGSRRSRERR